MILWLTGNSGAGKSTLARRLSDQLPCVVLDGDEMRASISQGAGFSRESRHEHNLKVARLAKVLEGQGHLVVVAVIAPYAATRREISEIASPTWVYLKRSGLDSPDRPYEPPDDAIVLDIDTLSAEAAAQALLLTLGVPDPVYIITGHPRSGTSMLMQALEAGGMPVVKSAVRDRLIDANSDKHYRMNPESLYEPAAAQLLDASFPKAYEGMAVKVVMPFVRRISAHRYHVVCMRRDAEEIRQSARAAYGAKLTTQSIEREVSESLAVLGNRRDVLTLKELHYRDVLADPQRELASLDWPLDVEKASAIVEADRYRFRRERLVVGL